MKMRLNCYKTKHKTKREHTACGGATTLFFLLAIACGITLASCSPNASPTQSGPVGPYYFTLHNGGTSWTDSTPSCYFVAYGFLRSLGVMASTPAYPHGDSTQEQFGILFENTWGKIPTGTFSASQQDVSVQTLLPDGTTDKMMTDFFVTISRVDNTGIYGTFSKVTYYTQTFYDSGSFHVPAPQ